MAAGVGPLLLHYGIRRSRRYRETERRLREYEASFLHFVLDLRRIESVAQVLVRGGELIMIGPAAPDPLMIYSTLRPVGEHTFRVETKDGRVETWEDH